jgi:enoyl-CoA hydratase/carnithine racemase
MILGGDMINAEQALLMRLVDMVVKDEDPLSYALHFISRITEGRPVKIINYVMQALKNAKRLSRKDCMLEETRMFCDLARIEAGRRKRVKSEE